MATRMDASYVISDGHSRAFPIERLTMPRNPDWTRDELILTLDLYFRSGRRLLDANDMGVIELSSILNRLPVHAGETHGADFRNPNGISMNLANWLTVDPAYSGAGLQRGNRLLRVVWATFANEPEKLRLTALAIRNTIDGRMHAGGLSSPTIDDEEEFPEGRILTQLHMIRERNPSAVRRKKRQVLDRTSHLRCEACEFDFLDVYGELGRAFAECHHQVPISELHPDQSTRLTDLAIVCANCHRMLHRSRPLLAVEALRKLIVRIGFSRGRSQAALPV